MNSGNDILRAYCLSDVLSFTKYNFMRRFKRRFIVNDHHVLIAEKLNKILKGEITKLIINIAPRYTKTELAVKNFIAMGFALNPASKFIHLSYSDDLANDNSEEIRDVVKSDYYKQLFPYVEVSKTTDSKKKWNTTKGGGLYAVSTGGQVTGFGAGDLEQESDDGLMELIAELEGLDKNRDRIDGFSGAIIIDDPIKPEDALSDVKRERVNTRFETTIRSRVNSRNTPIIIVMQRLHERDLCGYLLSEEPDEWDVLSLPCIIEEEGEEKALWTYKHTLEELYHLRDRNSYVFETQYQQDPKPIEGLMYREFGTYETLPNERGMVIKNYTDTADTGTDYLCSINYIETKEFIYVLDVLYTKKPMEYTEPETARMIVKGGVTDVFIESNNGGRGFARNVEKECKEIGASGIFFEWFFQSENKQVRIFTKSADVNNMILFPKGWEFLWSEFHRDVVAFRKEGKNANDDAPDALTGCVEKIGKRAKRRGITIR